MLPPQLTASAIVLVGCAATICDLRTRRIPNLLTGSTALAGLFVATAGLSGMRPAAALIGLAVGAALMLPGYALGTTGAGDVKLMAAFGAWLGPNLIVAAFLCAAVAGGLVAVAVAVSRGRLGAALTGAAQMAATPADAKAMAARRDGSHRFAFGPAIAAGAAAALWVF